MPTYFSSKPCPCEKKWYFLNKTMELKKLIAHTVRKYNSNFWDLLLSMLSKFHKTRNFQLNQ